MSHYLGHPDQQFGAVTYAQHGDDLMIMNLFNLLGQKTFSWLDLGAYHPFDISNTALAYSRGSRGVNIEANPYLIEAFHQHRPEDTNVCVGVGFKEDHQIFYSYGPQCGRNTFSPDEVESLKDKMEVQHRMTLPVLTVNQIIARFCNGFWPDLLLTDIEGLDYAVLKSAIFLPDNHPKIIVTETRRQDTARFESILINKYILVCRMGENLFFADRNYREQIF